MSGSSRSDEAALKGCATTALRRLPRRLVAAIRHTTVVAQAFRPARSRQAFLAGLVAVVVASVSVAATGIDPRLIRAVKDRDVDAVRALVAARPPVDVNATAGDGGTALHWAVHRDDLA